MRGPMYLRSSNSTGCATVVLKYTLSFLGKRSCLHGHILFSKILICSSAPKVPLYSLDGPIRLWYRESNMDFTEHISIVFQAIGHELRSRIYVCFLQSISKVMAFEGCFCYLSFILTVNIQYGYYVNRKRNWVCNRVSHKIVFVTGDSRHLLAQRSHTFNSDFRP